MDKRISVRGIIIEDDYIYAFFRRKNGREYYAFPGGGVEEGEIPEETVVRELKEEFSVDIEVIKYLDTKEEESTIVNFFLCKIINGIPKLGGEELLKHSEDNYYEIRKVRISEIDNIDIYHKDLIKRAILETKKLDS